MAKKNAGKVGSDSQSKGSSNGRSGSRRDESREVEQAHRRMSQRRAGQAQVENIKTKKNNDIVKQKEKVVGNEAPRTRFASKSSNKKSDTLTVSIQKSEVTTRNQISQAQTKKQHISSVKKIDYGSVGCIDVDDDISITEVDDVYLGKRKPLLETPKTPLQLRAELAGTHSPLKSILKTSPMYSPIKSAQTKKGIQIREELNTMKNFFKDKLASSPQTRSKNKYTEQMVSEMIDAQDILNSSAGRGRLESPLPSKSLHKRHTSEIDESKRSQDLLRNVSFSVMKPSYVGRGVVAEPVSPGEQARSVSPVRFIERVGPRYFAERTVLEDVNIRDIFDEGHYAHSGKNEVERDISRNSLPRSTSQSRGERIFAPDELSSKIQDARYLIFNLRIVETSPALPFRHSSPTLKMPFSLSSSKSKAQEQDVLFMPETVDWSPKPKSSHDCSYEEITSRLLSRDERETKSNARLLLDIAKTFSMSFNLQIHEVIAAMVSVDSPFVNMEQVRKSLMRRAMN
jgi:hypothetical protein